jgi:hypothetical protein
MLAKSKVETNFSLHFISVALFQVTFCIYFLLKVKKYNNIRAFILEQKYII